MPSGLHCGIEVDVVDAYRQIGDIKGCDSVVISLRKGHTDIISYSRCLARTDNALSNFNLGQYRVSIALFE